MLTLQEKATYRFIVDYIKTHQISPTTQQIAQAIGIRSKGTAHRYIKALEKEKMIVLHPGKRRNIELVDNQKNTHKIKVIGKIAAGKPIEAIQYDHELELSQIFMGVDRYALKVQGDSMIDEGIMDGDIVICQHTQSARNGEIVIALIDGQQATLKRIQFNQDSTITLNPSNKSHYPQTYPCDNVQIQGIFIGLLRIAT